MDKLKKDSLSDLVYSQIANMIMNRDLLPGEKINKKEVADLLGVSQTPVNEAILRFASEGVIEQKERQGFYLKVFTDNDMKEMFLVRAGLEGVAIRVCVEEGCPENLSEILNSFDKFQLPLNDSEYKKYREADKKFHESILLSSGNSVIEDFIRNFDFILKCYQKGLIRTPEETLPEHQQIVAAIRSGNAQEAQNLVMAHHLKTRSYIREHHLK